MESQKPKCTIEFKLTPKAKSTSLLLLRNCILDKMPQNYGSTYLAKAQVLLKAYRYQYYRAITAQLENRRAYTYALNCPPCGFNALQKTKTCRNPKVSSSLSGWHFTVHTIWTRLRTWSMDLRDHS